MHNIYMKRALALAELGLGRTSPNPMVGCVIVKNNIIIGEGWHHEYGKPHAEIEALNDAKSHGADVKGSTLYVTLEPCAHYGKTPPCAERIVKEGISEVIIAMKDPNSKVDGKGIKILRDAGIKISDLKMLGLGGELESKAKFLNKGFIFLHKFHRPFVTIKAAMSLDGKLCLANGSSKWITGILARTKTHKIRSENDAILVGVNTILNDNPELSVRHVKGCNPARVILDTNLKIPLDAKVIGHDGKCLILTSEYAPQDKAKILESKTAKVFRLKSCNNHIDLKSALELLASQGILTLMVEGGAEILSSFLREKLADYANFFFSPKILGEGKGFSLNMNFANVNEAFMLTNINTCNFGNDFMIEGRFACSPDL